MPVIPGDSRYRETLRAREAEAKVRICQRIGALLPVTVRGVVVNVYGLVDKEQTVFDHKTQSEQVQRVFRIPRQLYQNDQTWTWANGIPAAPIWFPGVVYCLEGGATISYEGFNWAIQSVTNPDTKRIEFYCTALRTHVRRL